MKSLSYQAKLNFPKTTFAVCTLDANLLTKETIESPRLQNISGRTTAVSNSPSYKVKRIPIPAFDKVTGRRKETSPKLKQSKSIKMEAIKESIEIQSYRNLTNKKDEFQAHMDELDSPVRIQRVTSGGAELPSSPVQHRASSVRIIPLNPQIRIKDESQDEERVNVAFQQKFMKKYNHFRRTQNNAINHCLGRFSSIAEIKDRVSSIQMEPVAKNTFADWENEIARACPTEREKAILQKKVKQIVRLRRKILDGEIDFSKYVEQDNKRNFEKATEDLSTNPYSNTSRFHGQGPVVVKPPAHKHLQRGSMGTMRDSALSRWSKSEGVKPEEYVRNLKSENTSRQTSKSPSLALYNTSTSRGGKRNVYSEKVNPNRLKQRSNAPAKQVVNIHTEKMKYRTQSLEVSLLADSRGQKTPIDGDLLDSPDKSIVDPDVVKVSSIIDKEEKVKLPSLKKVSVRNINNSNEEYLSVQAGERLSVHTRSRRSSSKRNSLDDVDDLKLEGWPQNDRILTKENK